MATGVVFAIVGPLVVLAAFGIGIVVGRQRRPDRRAGWRCPLCLTAYLSASARDTCRETCQREAARQCR